MAANTMTGHTYQQQHQQRRLIIHQLLELQRLHSEWTVLTSDGMLIATRIVNAQVEKIAATRNHEDFQQSISSTEWSLKLNQLMAEKNETINTQLVRLDKVHTAMVICHRKMQDIVYVLKSFADELTPAMSSIYLLHVCTLPWLLDRTAKHVYSFACDLSCKGRVLKMLYSLPLITTDDVILQSTYYNYSGNRVASTNNVSVSLAMPTRSEMQTLLCEWDNSPLLRDADMIEFRDLVELISDIE